MKTLLWVVAPYVTLVLLVGGTFWRYRYDRFGWTTRSSQLYEHRLLRVASPLFHFGLIFVILGHLLGLVVPEHWTADLGVSERGYHWLSLVTGSLAGLATLVGLALLVYRRRATGPVFMATTRNDKLMYVLLGAAIVLGLAATLIENGVRGGYDYRQTVSPWFRDIFVLQPHPSLMADVPLLYKLHVVVGMVLFALFPFTRLVHAFAAPVGYLFRPYIVYRSRTDRRPAPRGWDPVSAPRRR